ncbi:hypothetical protein W97_04216 [Coniosporium apollinis CBS 100218]|uniref:Large ribosomal subunit protein mL59 domain-containing protein n=1 Tax=Coniosporium apollinis (strain CBS 100218) TaxID=1168221 RepID=R7YTG8_CONA1|nr:uncharacterized protein W97_04216 [Coniosporium apollinis CBS 100218]EON64981.1 hypothetical protein W97_04216 [Coniosporium apollinis CBS 100218]
MALAHEHHIRLAQKLPSRLLTFFARYPPPVLLQQPATTPAAPDAFSSPNAAEAASPTEPATPTSHQPTTTPPQTHNPFAPWRNPTTSRWRPPVFSARRQAELVKLAAAHGLESLLPPTAKGSAERASRREEHGLRVKGTGAGQRVKGKLWERTLKGRLEGRRKAMEGMPGMIEMWKQRGHGRGWKKWPK